MTPNEGEPPADWLGAYFGWRSPDNWLGFCRLSLLLAVQTENSISCRVTQRQSQSHQRQTLSLAKLRNRAAGKPVQGGDGSANEAGKLAAFGKTK